MTYSEYARKLQLRKISYKIIPYTQNLLIFHLVSSTTEFLRQVGKNLLPIYIGNLVFSNMTYSKYARKLKLRKILY
jgi:hypothetical protein